MQSKCQTLLLRLCQLIKQYTSRDSDEIACKDAALDWVSLKPKLKHRAPWESKAVIKGRKQLSEAATAQNANPRDLNKAKFKRAQASLSALYDAEQQAYLQSKIDLISNASPENKAATPWKTINEICGRKSTSKAKMKASSQQERLDLWREHF